MSDKPNEEPKLIIDEDWKTQVQREKEELKERQQAAESQAAGAETVGAETVRAEDSGEPVEQGGVSQPVQPSVESPADESSADKSAGAVSETGDGAAGADQAFGGPPPPASLMLLANTLATQAMGAMGLIADDKGEPIPANFDFARHFIDMLDVLEQKTKGNVTDEEAAFLKEALHQLRLAFVAVSKKKS